MAAPWNKESLYQAIKEDPNFCEKCPSLAADIFSRRLELVKLVEYLKDFLTDTQPVQRGIGVLVLSSVLKELPSDFLKEDEIRFLVAFFCDRLKDHSGVVPSTLKGILAISKMKNISKELPGQMLNTLMLNLSCQTERQEDRLNIYRILDALVIPHAENLKSISPDLVYHVISTIDGERDPRNLMFLFSMLPSIFRSLSLGHLTEDCFEVVSCYFPVDFKPALEDPNQLTREDLAFALAECLTAVPVFAEFCIPLLLEKLDSPLRVAKLDSLYLLSKGCLVFPAESVAVHLSPLWMSLSREALTGGPDFDVRNRALEAITLLLRCLSDIPMVNDKKSDPSSQLLDDIISASTSALGEVHTSLFLPATELLLAAAKSGSMACEHIVRKVIPIIVDYYNTKSEASESSVYLGIISKLLALCKLQGVNPQNFPNISIQWSQLVQLYLAAAEHEAILIRKEALVGLATLSCTLSVLERPKLYNLLSVLLDQECISDVRAMCKLCLLEVGDQYPSEISGFFLTEKLKFDCISGDDPRFERRIEAQCCLAALRPFTEEILPTVMNLVVISKDANVTHIILSSVRNLLESLKSGSDHVYESLHRNSIISLLLNWWISGEQDGPWMNHETILDEVCFIVSNISRNLRKEDQVILMQQVLPQFHLESDSIRPYEVILLESVIGNLHCDVAVANADHLCCTLTDIALRFPHTSSITSASRLCASILNKMMDDKLLDQTLVEMNKRLKMANIESEVKDAVQVATIIGWISKGLAMRGYKQLEQWIDKLVDILADSRQLVAMSAAQAFQIIMEDDPRFLNCETHCSIRIFYKQRVFVSSLKLVKASKQATITGRIAYLLALTHLLSGVPQTVLANYIGEILPLLLESLSQDSPVLLEAALSTLLGLLSQSVYEDSLKDQIQTMVPRLLPLTCYQNHMNIRRSALRCLSQICCLPTELLLPFKDEVVSRLEMCLDDPKRLVRKDAVKARSNWIMIAAPGSKRK